MTGYVETAPEFTGLQAPDLRLHLNVAGIQTPAVIILDVVEQPRPEEPGEGGEGDPGQMLDQDRSAAAAKRVGRQGHPGYDHGQQPAPAPLDEVPIQSVVGPGEVSTWHRDEVRDQRDREYHAAVDGDLEPGVEQERLLAHVQQHGDEDEADGARGRGWPGATAILLLRETRPKVHAART